MITKHIKENGIEKAGFGVRCSWCGKTTTMKALKPDRTSGKTDYFFYCQTCKSMRYIKEKDID